METKTSYKKLLKSKKMFGILKRQKIIRNVCLYKKIKTNSYFLRYICTSIRKFNCAEPACKGKYEILTVDSSLCDPCIPGPTVVIVGAGIAGLSAAQRLMHCGISKITILEATERPGGRIHSCWLGDVVAEMGAQFIEGGCVSNPIYNLACEEGLLKHPVVRPDPSKGVFCTSEGRPIDSPTSISAYQAFRQIKDEAAALFTLSSNRRGSLQNFFGIRIQQELKNFPSVQRFDAGRVMYGLVNAVKTRWNEDLSLLSANRFGSYISMPGGDLTIPIGFIGVIAPLLRDLPENGIRYSKPVETIKWGSVTDRGPRAIVRCSDGEEFETDYVIVTVPLGVLKSNVDKMFCPGLPREKLEAIKNIGYGNCDKIFLEYSKPFWVSSELNIKFAWSAEELAKSTDWVTGLASVDEIEGSSHILCARISGKEATMMEQCSDEEVAVKITQVLRQFTGDYCLPYPCSILRSKWGSNPHFQGGYSYMGLNTSVGHQFTLAEPIPGTCESLPPVLLFAGEATCPGHFSTVHGARLSGVREAERIVQLTKEYGGPPTGEYKNL